MRQIAKNRRAPQHRCGACGPSWWPWCVKAWTTLGVGDLISGNYQNNGAWYPGRIVKVLARKGYYNVKYDGDSESNVATACLALVQSAEEDAAMRRGKGAGTKRKAPVDSGSNNGQKKQRKG